MLRCDCRSSLFLAQLKFAMEGGRATARILTAQHPTVHWRRNTDVTIFCGVAAKPVPLLQSSATVHAADTAHAMHAAVDLVHAHLSLV